MTESTPEPVGPPEFGARRLLIVGTGSVSVSSLPHWIHWLRVSYPDLAVRVLITRAAERFVTLAALSAVAHAEVTLDVWPDGPQPTARHVELAEWAEATAVYPASMHFLARLALGLTDTPSLLAMHCMRAPIGVAPALPPGAMNSVALKGHLTALAGWPNLVIARPQPGLSWTTGNRDGLVPAPLPQLLRLIEKRRSARSTAPDPPQ